MEDLNYPWVEEYRPQKVEDVIGAEDLVGKMNEYIDSRSIPHLLFLGTAGTGKTTTAKILAKDIAGEDGYLYINASDERGMDTIRNKVQDFCSVASFADLKIVILDEADGLTLDAQKILRAVTEQYAKTCRFILTANYETKLLEPVRSRFQTFKFKGASKNDIAKRCWQIMSSKGIQLDAKAKEDLGILVKTYYPDIRSTINNLQRCCRDGTFSFVESGAEKKTLEKFLTYVKEHSVRKIREEILSAGIDYDSLYNALYENIKTLTTNAEKGGEIIVLLANYQYQNSSHANRELNFVACLIEIIQTLRG
jgi:replication factor C small subunit